MINIYTLRRFFVRLMPNSRPHITGILLAGGMSQRMGSEKGSIRIGSSLLYQYPLGILEELCDEILISTCKPSLFREKHTRVCDEIKEIGPLGGIYSCLKRSSTKLNLVLSYDMPMVNASLLDLLIGEAEGYDMVLPAGDDEKPEPLCGIYNRSTIELIEKMISRKDFAVNQMLKQCRGKLIRITREMDAWSPGLFLNINTREDLKGLPDGFGA